MPTPTPTGTDLQISTDASFTKIVNTDDGTYRTSQRFEKDALPYGQTLYARVRHKSAETGESNWSATVTFNIVVPAQIIGVCIDNSNSSTKGTFYWIDALGNQLSSFDWQSHPCYSNISMVTVDSDRAPVTLTRFPLTYVKTAASGPAGSFANGKKCWWISNLPYIGFHPAACFKRTTSRQDGKYVISDYCYMGTFLGHQESAGGKTVIGSKRGQTVLASQTKETFKTYITNRNNTSAGITGFRMFDIWDLGLLRTLALVAKANSDTQSQWGDNSSGISSPKTGSTNARMVFKGSHSNPEISIEDLWRCYWYHADLITINSGQVTLTSPMDLSSSLSFGSASSGRYTQPTSSGWIRDVLDCPFTIGDDEHDLMELFLPKTVVSAENQGTFSDYHTTGTNTSIRVGCNHTEVKPSGLFSVTFDLETTPGSLGNGTAYCGRIFFAHTESSNRYSCISTGISTSKYLFGHGSVPSSCKAFTSTYEEFAPCRIDHKPTTCPKGWGSLFTLKYYEPGCKDGTYYSDPIRPSNVSPTTGTRLSKN